MPRSGHVVMYPITADKASVGHAVIIGSGLVSSASQIQYTVGGSIVFDGNGKLQVGL